MILDLESAAFPNLDQLKSVPASGVTESDGNFGSVLKNAINQVKNFTAARSSRSRIC